MNARPIRLLSIALPLAALASCSGWFFSGIQYPDRSRPVVRVDTRGGVEYGAATEFGVLFLGRTATEGPCRVHYFLGDRLLIDDGSIEPFGGPFLAANIDLRHQGAKLFTEPVRPYHTLLALVIDDRQAIEVPVQLASSGDVEGDVLVPPGRPLPVGTPLFVDDGERRWFVGLVSGEAVLERPNAAPERFVVFAGLDQLREALEVPENEMAPVRIKYRPDGVWVEEQDRRGARAPRAEPDGGER